jgi:hypothetical protein
MNMCLGRCQIALFLQIMIFDVAYWALNIWNTNRMSCLRVVFVFLKTYKHFFVKKKMVAKCLVQKKFSSPQIMPFCKVKYCRHPNSHTTAGHECGKCHFYGHGQSECGNESKLLHLRQFYNHVLPREMQCNILDCKYSANHTVSAHKCTTCNKLGHDCAKTVVCPSCKTANKVDFSIELHTGSDCIVCFESTKMVLLKTCKHANVCKTCALRLAQ